MDASTRESGDPPDGHGKDRDGAPAMLPDDWRYEFIEDAAGALSESEGNLDRARDYLNESDHYAYTSQRTGWLHSHNVRSVYVDEAREQGLAGDHTDTDQAIRIGMLMEQEEVLDLVYSALSQLADDDE